MRTILTFLFSLQLTLVYCQIPNYFANNPSWHGITWVFDNFASSFEHDVNLYYLNGDTTISGKVYSKMFVRGGGYEEGDVINYFSYSIPLPPLEIRYDYDIGKYVRQDGRTIMIVEAGEANEELLISYDYKVGDTVKGIFNDMMGCYINDTIQKIDSVLVGSEYRKQFYVDSTYGLVLVEGIANLQEKESTIGDVFFGTGCDGISFGWRIYCYGQNGVPLWGYGSSECTLNLSTKESNNFKFSFYPNPTLDKITIESEEIVDVKITNISGQNILSIEKFLGNKMIDLTDFSKGIFFITVSNKSANKTYKIVKM